jgi:hypothetical protein
LLQGELEHRSPKGNYKRTSKKNFKKQLVQIDRRKARIRRIRQKMSTTGSISADLPDTHFSAGSDAAQCYRIGISQNQPQEIGIFLRTYLGDPAIKVGRTLIILGVPFLP